MSNQDHNKSFKIKRQLKSYGIKTAVICFWLMIWAILSYGVVPDIFLASPLEVIDTLIDLCRDLGFWEAIGFSTTRIILGFIMALFVGTLFAVGAYKNALVRELVSPLMKLVKAMPVASFILLALLWFNSKSLPILCSFLMVVPLIYSNVLEGLKTADIKLLQMAEVFKVSRLKRVLAIYVPSVLPFFISAVSVGFGFSWKAGIAAEVISFPSGSIGERLYEAKLYIMTKELFAWTAVIILVSVLLEKVILWLLHRLQRGGSRQSYR